MHDLRFRVRAFLLATAAWRTRTLAGMTTQFLSRPTATPICETRTRARSTFPTAITVAAQFKPDVVFFGESVPQTRVESAYEATERADALLVVGSSLMVFSGFRFARHAHEHGKPIAIINRGHTRADDLATLKIDADCGTVLGQVAGD